MALQMARLLLGCGARVDVHDGNGLTALHHAVLGQDKVRGSGTKIGVGVSQ